MRLKLGLELEEPGGYLLEMTRDSKELGTEPGQRPKRLPAS